MAHIEDRRWTRRADGDRIRSDYRGDQPWRARYRTPDKRARAKSFARKIDAERFLTQIESRKLTGDYIDPSAGRVTFESYAETWRTMQVHRATTAAQVESNMRLHVYPALGARPLGQIRPSELQAWVKSLEAKLAPGTVETIYRYVVAVLRSAVEDSLIRTNPARTVKLPKIEPTKVVPLTVEQVWALIDAAPDRYRALILTAAGTGLRQGECFGLTVDRVDFLRRRLTVDRQLVLMPGAGPKFGPPKTTASYRDVPLPDVVLDALSAHLAARGPADDGLVFTNDAGEPIRRTRFSDLWRPTVATAELPKGTRFHDLRHHYASLLIHHGESVKVVQSRLGHASAAETLDTYGHLWPDSEDRTRQAVDELLGTRDQRPAVNG